MVGVVSVLLFEVCVLLVVKLRWRMKEPATKKRKSLVCQDDYSLRNPNARLM